MKNNRVYILAVAVLAVLALILFLTRSQTTFKKALSDFAVDDSSNVTKIFMSDKRNNSMTLSRTPKGTWLVNDHYLASKSGIDMLLSTIVALEVKEPVALAARNNIIRQLAANSVKVEIYQKVYRVDLFGKIRWFPHEKKTKVYYVGGATPSNRGTFMLMENSTEPFITYLPGLRGFVSPRYQPIEKYWRDYTIFRENIHQIASVKVEFPGTPQESYVIRNNHERSLDVISLADGRPVANWDTLKVMTMFTAFSRVGFEAVLNDFDPHRKDSILASQPLAIITLTDTSGVSNVVKTYRRGVAPGDVDDEGRPLLYDRDRLFALVNNGQDFVLIQYLIFDRIMRPKSYFLREAKLKK
jgi:hypothetical protein